MAWKPNSCQVPLPVVIPELCRANNPLLWRWMFNPGHTGLYRLDARIAVPTE